MDLYVALGLGRGASLGEIRRAYRRLARRYHPEVNPGNDEAEALFRRIVEAYETLSHPDKRRAYDSGASPEAPSAAGRRGAGVRVRRVRLHGPRPGRPGLHVRRSVRRRGPGGCGRGDRSGARRGSARRHPRAVRHVDRRRHGALRRDAPRPVRRLPGRGPAARARRAVQRLQRHRLGADRARSHGVPQGVHAL